MQPQYITKYRIQFESAFLWDGDDEIKRVATSLMAKPEEGREGERETIGERGGEEGEGEGEIGRNEHNNVFFAPIY